ncbi:hypothetical protein J3E72DRAFT_320067 [Bipolaris maydis]|uniref:uncharacterized protein n=1 Tax=Cochliobolus heterostrophus TaxID=5016 RepID=UPI0024D6D19D|nr:hypothetical protein J3E73DRAFT_352035 [Bipolaris maydis]KAJ5061402.1 hypothetical protein J3E74DRAFT_340138 [Bipolaris maydis]KAJ6198531.1 hypothetical protein J3E72DRAFT_320067 [Bipolaris maydis]KAJ6210679.1 hypothetical protein PSV09DRAFT_2305570 [Bipolaris maydis]KAJ6271802.1 hypothetical protein PSV08DRAFT_285250 [Bipolaris maydis]
MRKFTYLHGTFLFYFGMSGGQGGCCWMIQVLDARTALRKSRRRQFAWPCMRERAPPGFLAHKYVGADWAVWV